MNRIRTGRGVISVAGAAVLIGVGALTAACGTSQQPAPATSTTTTTSSTPTSASPPEATPKNLSPTGGNLFTPGVLAPPAPTEPPGVHRNK